MTTLTFTQGIVSHSTTTGLPGGAQNFLVINSDKVDLHAPVDQPFVSVFAQRDAHYLLTLQSGADIQAWGYGAPTGNNGPFDNVNGGGLGTNEYYLYIDIDRATGATTYGHSKFDPASGATPPLANIDRQTDQHWFDTNTRTMRVWRATGVGPNYGNWTEVVRLFVAKYVYSSSFSSLSVNSPSYIGTTVGLTGTFRAGALIYDVIGNPVLRTDSNNVTVFFTTEDVFTSGLPATSSPVSGNRARYETFLVDAIGVSPAPAYSIVRFDDFSSVLPLDPIAQPTSLWVMIEFPIGASGDLVQVTMSGVVRNATWSWSIVGQQIFVDKDNPGILTTVEDDNYIPLPQQLPVGVAIDETAILLRRPELALTTAAVTAAVDHGTLTGLGGDDHPQYLLVDGTRAMSGNLNMGSNNVTTVGNVDGRDVSADGAVLDAHVANTAIHVGSPITLSHTSLLNIGTNTHSQIDAHIANTAIHVGSPISISHTSLSDIGTNTHVQIDTHISDTTIHQPLTVEDVLGSPLTSVSNVNTIQFNNSSGFDVVDQTGGVVRIDFNSAFNPIIVQGGSPVTTLTASGEEPLKLIAGTNIALTGNAGSTPKEITITSTASGGGIGGVVVADEGTELGGSPNVFTKLNFVGAGVTATDAGSGQATITIPGGGGGSPVGAHGHFRIQDGDNDTFVDTQFSAGSPADTDPDHIRLETATSSAYSPYGGRIDIGSGSGSNGGVINILGGTLNTGTGTSPYISYGASININAAVNDIGGSINISGGNHGAYNVGAASIYIGGGNYDSGIGGTITITAGPGQTGVSPLAQGYNGGEVQIYGGDSAYTTAGDVKIYGGNALGGGEYDGGRVAIRGGTTSGTGSTRGNVVIQGNRVFLQSDGAGATVPTIEISSVSTSQAPILAFRERSDLGSGFIALKSTESVPLGANQTWTLPLFNPTSAAGKYFLSTNDQGFWSFELGAVTVQDEGTNIGPGSPQDTFHTFNFTGTGVTATDAGSGVVNISVTGGGGGGTAGVVVADEGTDIGGSPSVYTKLNFVGATVTASDAGGGQANITVTAAGLGSPNVVARKYTEVVSFSGSPLSANINHNLNEKYVVVQLYDSNDEQIGANTIRLIDADNLEVSVNTALSGVTVVVIG